MKIMTLLAVLLVGGGGRGEGEGGPNSLPPVPCIPRSMLPLQLHFIVTIIPYSRRLKFSDFYTLSQTEVLEHYTFHSSSNCISVAQMWQLVPSLQSLGVQLYLIYLLLPYL